MDEMIFAYIFIALFFIVMVGLGIWFTRRAKTGSDAFILAGRQAPWFIVAGSIFATWVNTATLLGYGGTGYTVGISGYWSGGAFMLATVWLGFFMIPRLRKTGITTIPEFFEKYFGVSHRLVALVLGLGRDMGVTAGISIAMAFIFQDLFDVTLFTALLITIGVVLLYTGAGGMWAVLYTDTIASVLIIVGTTLMIPLAVAQLGEWSMIAAEVPSSHLEVWGAGVPQSIGWLLTGVFITFGYQTVIQRGLAAKDDETAKKAFLGGGLLALFWYMVPFVLGTIGRALYPDIYPDDAFIELAYLYGPYVGIFFMIVLISSAMSTISSCILGISSNLSLDVYQRLINQQATREKIVWVQRFCLLLVIVIAAIVGHAMPFVLELLWLGGRVMAAGMAPVFLALIFWPKARIAAKTTMAAMVTGAALTVIGQLYGWMHFGELEGEVVFIWETDPILFGLPFSVLILLLGVPREAKRRIQERAA